MVELKRLEMVFVATCIVFAASLAVHDAQTQPWGNPPAQIVRDTHITLFVHITNGTTTTLSRSTSTTIVLCKGGNPANC